MTTTVLSQTIWNDAGLLREYAAQRYGKCYAHGGGSWSLWKSARRCTARLMKLTGHTQRYIEEHIISDYYFIFG